MLREASYTDDSMPPPFPRARDLPPDTPLESVSRRPPLIPPLDRLTLLLTFALLTPPFAIGVLPALHRHAITDGLFAHPRLLFSEAGIYLLWYAPVLLLLITDRIGRSMMRRRIDRWLETRPNATSAERAAARARRRDPARPFSHACFRNESDGEEPPALLLMDHAWPRSAPTEAISETIDLGPARARGAQERRAVKWTLIILASVAMVTSVIGFLAGDARSMIWWGLLFVAIAIFLRPVIARRGANPFDVSALLVSPKRVEKVRLGRATAFTPEDTTLVLERARLPGAFLIHLGGAILRAVGRLAPFLAEPLARAWRRIVVHFIRAGWLTSWRRIERALDLAQFSPPVRATLIRDDGKSHAILFLSGRPDPSLADLTARWLDLRLQANAKTPVGQAAVPARE